MTEPQSSGASPTARKDLRVCDLVMEGGVTSAVIYAALVSRLSEGHRFKSLGGASSGAVAAAAAAIAEAASFKSGDRQPFQRLDQFVEKLAKEDAHGWTGLRRLFQPAPALRPAFRVAMKVLEVRWKNRRWRASAHVVISLLIQFPLAAGLGMLVALLTQAGPGFFSLPPLDDWRFWIRALAALFAGAVLAVVVALLAFVCCIARHLPANQLGLCRGLTEPDHTVRGALARFVTREFARFGRQPDTHGADNVGGLTDELHTIFNALDGRGPEHPPVTFGDLWNPCNPKQPADKREVDLQIITTALQLHRPFQLPGYPGADEHPLTNFFYDPEEWRHFFPRSVMEWLLKHARPCDLTVGESKLCALPPAAKWPVLMAARMSLSFPLLLSAVPMYTLWRGHGVVKPPEGSPVRFSPQRVFFSDGAVTSNCPVDLFDVPLPEHPTFIVSLYPEVKPEDGISRQGEPKDEPHLYTPRQTPESAPAEVPKRGLEAVWDLLRRIMDTSLGWRDSLGRSMPGIRDRVLYVPVPEGLGGLNLCMSRKEINTLAELGRMGAEKLKDFFVPTNVAVPSGWDQHRWVRLRTGLTALSAHHRDLVRYVGAKSGEAPNRAMPAYPDLLNVRPQPEPQWVGDAARLEAQKLLTTVEGLIKECPDQALEQNSPEPLPRLQIRLTY